MVTYNSFFFPEGSLFWAKNEIFNFQNEQKPLHLALLAENCSSEKKSVTMHVCTSKKNKKAFRFNSSKHTNLNTRYSGDSFVLMHFVQQLPAHKISNRSMLSHVGEMFYEKFQEFLDFKQNYLAKFHS